jgi:hypothetical protein
LLKRTVGLDLFHNVLGEVLVADGSSCELSVAVACKDDLRELELTSLVEV